MKIRFSIVFAIFLGVVSMVGSASADNNPPLLPPDRLDQLFGPIALYPDALIALILPASTVPSDVVMAARYLNGNGDPAKAGDQGWDDSVTALTHYPDVVKWLDENLAWTKQAGEAFLAQPADVMNAIQRLRARARAAGTLLDTPQQQVMVEGGNISIVPTQPEVIYVPSYDPEVVYLSRPGPYDDSFLSFGSGYATGFWLGYDFDWGHRRLWTIDRRDREGYWREHHDRWRPSYPGRPGYDDDHFHQQPWRPPARPERPSRPIGSRARPEIIPRPAPFPDGRPDRRPAGPGFRPDERDHSHNRPEREVQPSAHPENGPNPARTVVVPGPATHPEPGNVQNPNVNGRPSQPPPQNPVNRGDRESRGRDHSGESRNPPGRVMPLQPVPQPPRQNQPPTQPPPTARWHSPQPARSTVAPPAPSTQHWSRSQQEASSHQYRSEPSRRAQESDRDDKPRRDARQ